MKKGKKKSQSLAVNIMLCNLELGGTADREILSATIDQDFYFDLLYSPDVWICDTGASCHSMNNDTGATNVSDSLSESIGHV